MYEMKMMFRKNAIVGGNQGESSCEGVIER
jgi:hypothetical protein